MKENDVEVLELLIRHELAIKSLYQEFASLFAERQAFWQGLANDEQKHADRLGALKSAPEMSVWSARETQPKPQAIRVSIGYVENQVKRAQEKQLSSLQALAIARDLENALLEKQFSKWNAGASAKALPVFAELASETEWHRKMLAEALSTEKREPAA